MPAASASASAPASTASSCDRRRARRRRGSARSSSTPPSDRLRLASTARHLGRRLDPVRDPQPRRPGVERREPVVAPARARARRSSRGSSSVRGRSRNALAPAHTVTTGWWAMASRSADTSPVSSAPRCTPPIPPVANTAMPAARGERDRRRHRRRPEVPALGQRHRHVALGRLAGRPEDPRVLVLGDADPGHAVEHGRDRGHGAARSDGRECSARAPRRWPATAGRGGRRSSTPAPRRPGRRRAAAATSGDTTGSITAAVCRSAADEPGHGLDVGRVRERVDAPRSARGRSRRGASSLASRPSDAGSQLTSTRTGASSRVSAAAPGLPSPLRAGSASTTSTSMPARRASRRPRRGRRRRRRWPRLRSASATADRDVSMAITLAHRVGGAGGEHPDAGVGVDDDAGADELGRGPPHRVDEQLGRLRAGLEERAHRHLQAAARRRPRASTGAGSGGRAFRQPVHLAAAAVPAGRQLAGRRPTRAASARRRVEAQRGQQRGERRVGDEARRRGDDVVGVLGAEAGDAVRAVAATRTVVRYPNGSTPPPRSTIGSPMPPVRRRASATMATLASRWASMREVLPPAAPAPGPARRARRLDAVGRGVDDLDERGRVPSPSSPSSARRSTVSPGSAPRTNTTRPPSSRAIASPPAAKRSGRSVTTGIAGRLRRVPSTPMAEPDRRTLEYRRSAMARPIQIAPSVLPADFARLGDEVVGARARRASTSSSGT